MSTTYEPKIQLPDGAVAPDTYDPAIGGEPPANFVVSRHRDGTPASFYGDYIWNLSAYHPEGKTTRLYFSYWNEQEVNMARIALSREAIWITFATIWLRNGSTYALNTLLSQNKVIKALALYADESGCRVRDVLGNETRLKGFVEDRCAGGMLETFGALLSVLVNIGADRLGFSVAGNEVREEVLAKAREYRASLKQRPPMPTRIYSAILANLAKELDQWQVVRDDVLPLVSPCAHDPLYGRTRANQRNLGITGVYRPEFEDITSPNIRKDLVDRGKTVDVKGLFGVLLVVQMVAKLSVQAYTGMRDEEARALPYHCLKTTASNGRTHYIVLGPTTKLNDGRIKRTQWVTNKEGHRAVQIAQQIADTIYAVCGVMPVESEGKINDYPLFVAPRYLYGKATSQHDRFQTSTLEMYAFDTLSEQILPLIEEDDLKELERIDPHRAWRKETTKKVDRDGTTREALVFEIGKPWPLVTHQFRRSLALYAQRSGLVSMPSLRRQLQHLTEEMSRYYAHGSEFARNFIGDDKEHFGLEWQETKPESEFLSYVINVLLTDDVLFGGHVSWVEHRQKGPGGVILVDRAETLRRFKKGEIAYRETLIGGCTKVGECNQPALQWLNIDCIGNGCRHMVGNLKKLERAIAAQEAMVETLDRDSVEYRTEHADLEVLIAVRNKTLKQQETR